MILQEISAQLQAGKAKNVKVLVQQAIDEGIPAQKILEEGGVPATVRRTLGGDIDASCGQLRRKYNQRKA